MASSYGSAMPQGSRVDVFDPAAVKRGGASFHVQSIGSMAMPPLLMFIGMDITFAFVSGSYMPVALVFATICFLFAALLGNLGRKSVKGPFYTIVSILCFIATANGIMSGLSIQARFFGPYWSYEHRPIYTDVLATDPAAARSDAGVISFASNAVVDTFRSGNVQSAHGRQFCAAPILDESQQLLAEFWAVGQECCEGHVGYYCDAAQDLTAKSGAVVFEMDSWFVRDPYYKYIAAVKQAAARNQLQIPRRPILVRWVKDPTTITNGLWSEGMTHLGVGMLAYGFLAFVLAAVLHFATQPRSK